MIESLMDVRGVRHTALVGPDDAVEFDILLST